MLTFLFSYPALRLSRKPRAQIREVRKGKAHTDGGLSCHLPQITGIFLVLPNCSPSSTFPNNSGSIAGESSLRANPIPSAEVWNAN